MNVYVDSSVLLGIVLGEPRRLREWSRITRAVSSEITRVEGLRVLDRLRLAKQMDDRDLSRRRATLLELLEAFDLVHPNRAVLDRASEPFPVPIRTLEALHLASAIICRPRYAALKFATHDGGLADAALGSGFSVLGAIA